MWLGHLAEVAHEFRDNNFVIGLDLRNEIRAAHGVYPDWFSGDVKRDWATAALKASVEVNKVNPDLLLIVGGNWFNMFLCEVDTLPLHTFLPQKIVYECHAYSWYSIQLQIRGFIEVYLVSLTALTVVVWLGTLIYTLLLSFAPFCVKRTRRRCSRAFRGTQEHDSCCSYGLKRLMARVGGCLLRLLLRLFSSSRRKTDPILRGAVLSSLAMIGWGMGAWLASGCSIYQRACSVVMLILCGCSSILSFVAWLLLLLQFIFYDLPGRLSDVAQRLRPNISTDTASTDSARESSSSGEELLDMAGESRSPDTLRRAPLLDASSSNETSPVNGTSASSEHGSGVPVFISLFLASLVCGMLYAHSHFGEYKYLEQEYTANWGYLVKEDIAPVWVGEFGVSNLKGENDYWFSAVLKYMDENRLGWSYWPLDGQEEAGGGESFGLFEYDYLRYKDVLKMQLLSPLLNLTTNETTGDTFPPGFGPETWRSWQTLQDGNITRVEMGIFN